MFLSKNSLRFLKHLKHAMRDMRKLFEPVIKKKSPPSVQSATAQESDKTKIPNLTADKNLLVNEIIQTEKDSAKEHAS